MDEVTDIIGCMNSNNVDYTYCVVYPKDRLSLPDEKAKKLSHEMKNHQINHHIVGLYPSPEQPISESMILVYDVICNKHLLFDSYDDFSNAIKEMKDTNHLNRYGFFLSIVYEKVQNAYLATKNAQCQLSCREKTKAVSEKLFDLLLDLRLKQAQEYKEALIIEYNKQFDKEEYVSERDLAKSEGFYIDDDGNWMPDDDDDYDL